MKIILNNCPILFKSFRGQVTTAHTLTTDDIQYIDKYLTNPDVGGTASLASYSGYAVSVPFLVKSGDVFTMTGITNSVCAIAKIDGSSFVSMAKGQAIASEAQTHTITATEDMLVVVCWRYGFSVPGTVVGYTIE